MNVRKLYVPCVLSAMGTGGIVLIAASRTWASASVEAKGIPTDVVQISGSEAVPLVPALALVIVAAALAVLAASFRVRRGVGVFLTFVAVAGVVAALAADGDVNTAVTKAVRDSPAFIGTNLPAITPHDHWRFITAAIFAIAAVIGVLITRYGREWPTMGRKYDAPKAHAVRDELGSDSDIWKALDDGRDPTQ